MNNTFKRVITVMLGIAICISTMFGGVIPTAFADEITSEVTVVLIPGTESTASIAVSFDDGIAVRDIKAITSVVETVINSSYGELVALQSALKFDPNSKADQAAQKPIRELYTDPGHFSDPSQITVTGAPDGYGFKFVGDGDYSGHYVSHIRVIFERDEDGNALKDEDGNYIIKELKYAGSNGDQVLYYEGQPTTNIDGPFHYATGTRPQQFLLMDEAGNTLYAYCVDLETKAIENTWYAIANLEDNTYYASKEAEDHIRGILFNGYWGTAEGETGSLSKMKEALKLAIAEGIVDDTYEIHFTNRKKFETGYELKEGEYHYGNYVYWSLPSKTVTLTDEIIDGLTEGEALDAMQSAIWSYANGSNAALDGTDRVIVGDLSVASSAMSDTLNGKNDYEGAARTRALYYYLMQLTAPATSVVINDKTFAKNISLTIGNKVADGIYNVDFNFQVDFSLEDQDELTISLTYVDAYGETQVIEVDMKSLTADSDGYYTISGLTLKADTKFNFALNIFGKQYLEKNAYILTPENGRKASQSMVTMMEGWHNVDLTKSIDIEFTVNDTFTPKNPVKVVIEGEKYLDEEPAEDPFTFELWFDNDGDGELDLIETTYNDKNGYFAFPELTFDVAGEYEYIVKEYIDLENEDVIFDASVYTIVIKVTTENGVDYEAEVTITKDGEEYDEMVVVFNNKTPRTDFPNTPPPRDPGEEEPELGSTAETVWIITMILAMLGIVVTTMKKRKALDR